MDETNTGTANGNGNGKKWLQKLRTKVAEAVFSWLTLLLVSASLAFYYQNQLGLVVVTAYALCLWWCASKRSDDGSLPKQVKIVLVVLAGITALSNMVLMDVFPGTERLAVLEGINKGRSTMLKRFQPTFFLPKFYTVFYYDIDQSLATDCDRALKTADGDDFPATVSVSLKLINDQTMVSFMHNKMRGQEQLRAKLKDIACAAAWEGVNIYRTQMRFGSKRALTDKNLSLKLRVRMSLQGVQMPEDLLIENMTVMPLELKEENKDPI